MLHRRDILRAGFSAIGAIAGPAVLRAQTKPLTKVRYNEVVRSLLYAPYYVAATNGYLDAVPVEKLRQYEDDLYRYLDTRFGALLGKVRDEKTLSDDIKKELNSALDEFGKQFAATAA